jgi:hypothetical protein
VYEWKDDGTRGWDRLFVLAGGDVLETVQCCAGRQAPRVGCVDVWLPGILRRSRTQSC